jgi:inositol phosphorylceramide mannosyltransferase catalytic subunit
MQAHIPKRIIQTGKSLNLSLRDRAAVSAIKLLHPDYEYLFFDDAQVNDFVERQFPQYRPMFDSFRFRIQRFDFFRYLAVFHYGGFYFDLDVLLASELTPLLQHGCVFTFEALNLCHFLRNLGMDWLMGNYAFGAAPGHPFLEAVIKNCVKAYEDPDWMKPMMRGSPLLIRDECFVINSTGPGLVSRTLAENPELAKTVTVLFPDDVCDLRNWNLFGNYGVHLMESSWRAKRGLLHQKLVNYTWGWTQRRHVKRSSKLGKLRSHPALLPRCVGNVHD